MKVLLDILRKKSRRAYREYCEYSEGPMTEENRRWSNHFHGMVIAYDKAAALLELEIKRSLGRKSAR